MSVYSYSLSADFPNNLVDIDRLTAEIQASSITIALDAINRTGDNVDILFKASLSGTDETALTGVVAAHDGSPPAHSDVMEVKVQEEYGETGGKFNCTTVVLDAAPEATSTLDVTWPYPVSVLSMYFVSTKQQYGDCISLQIAPDTVIGVLVSDLGAGQTQLTVSATVLQYASHGDLISITDGTNTDQLGRLFDLDKINSTITVETASTHAFSAATPTYVRMSKEALRDFVIGPPWEYNVGDSKIGGTYIPANTIVRLIYVNHSPVDRLGAIVSDVALNDTIISVDAAVISEIKHSEKILLDDGSSVADLGRVTRIDKITNQLTVETGASAAFLAATPTFIHRNGKRFLGKIELLQ